MCTEYTVYFRFNICHIDRLSDPMFNILVELLFNLLIYKILTTKMQWSGSSTKWKQTNHPYLILIIVLGLHHIAVFCSSDFHLFPRPSGRRCSLRRLFI